MIEGGIARRAVEADLQRYIRTEIARQGSAGPNRRIEGTSISQALHQKHLSLSHRIRSALRCSFLVVALYTVLSLAE